jgi:hypothetical protein
MEKVSGPLAPRRRIATTLRELREKADRNLVDVAGAAKISSSKLSRLENAQGTPRLRDIRELIGIYGIRGTATASRLQQWAAQAQTPGWWTDYDTDVIEGMDRHLAYEADAVMERVYTLPFVPVLLATDAYGEAVYRDMERRTPEQIEVLMAIRRERQRALREREGLEPLRLLAVTHESALRQLVGSPRIHRDQLDELIARSHDDNVILRVLPFAARPLRTMTCMYAYFEYGDGKDLEQDVVHIETHAGFWSIDDPKRVAEYRDAHEALVDAALSVDDSRSLIEAIRDSIDPQA